MLFFPFKANYTDPLTKLRFSDASEFYRVRDLPMDIVNGLLELRKANSIVGWKYIIFDLNQCYSEVFAIIFVSTSSHEVKSVGQYRLWYFGRTLNYLNVLSWECYHLWWQHRATWHPCKYLHEVCLYTGNFITDFCGRSWRVVLDKWSIAVRHLIVQYKTNSVLSRTYRNYSSLYRTINTCLVILLLSLHTP